MPVEVPLIRSMWLSKKGDLVALRWKKDPFQNLVQTEIVEVQYAHGKMVRVRRPILEIFEPRSASEVGRGTVARVSVTCPVTGFTTPAKSVQAQLRARKGGASDARLYCVVSVTHDRPGRFYSIPDKTQLPAYARAADEFCAKQSEVRGNVSIFPHEPLPIMSGVFNAPIYGHDNWGSLFNSRQLLALSTYVDLARTRIRVAFAEDPEYGLALGAVLGMVIDRLADLNASLCGWQLSTPNTAHVFTRWALPMMMDYGEVNPLPGAGDHRSRRFGE